MIANFKYRIPIVDVPLTAYDKVSINTYFAQMAAGVFLKTVTDAGPMTATNGTQGEVVFNTSNSKAYVCTVTGSPATWAALN